MQKESPLVTGVYFSILICIQLVYFPHSRCPNWDNNLPYFDSPLKNTGKHLPSQDSTDNSGDEEDGNRARLDSILS
jgi:hypothetical protein